MRKSTLVGGKIINGISVEVHHDKSEFCIEISTDVESLLLTAKDAKLIAPLLLEAAKIASGK